MKKGDIKTWSNAKGSGKLFGMTLVDESGEIKATAFNETAEQLFPVIEANKVSSADNGSIY